MATSFSILFSLCLHHPSQDFHTCVQEANQIHQHFIHTYCQAAKESKLQGSHMLVWNQFHIK